MPAVNYLGTVECFFPALASVNRIKLSENRFAGGILHCIRSEFFAEKNARNRFVVNILWLLVLVKEGGI